MSGACVALLKTEKQVMVDRGTEVGLYRDFEGGGREEPPPYPSFAAAENSFKLSFPRFWLEHEPHEREVCLTQKQVF